MAYSFAKQILNLHIFPVKLLVLAITPLGLHSPGLLK